ncbi:MAG TPA: hypothetical protein VN285_05505 [Candidatus Deferrimicrobium sp.]|nr:hypothetical protein [Candidatus Deferrimicrobium sp.]
MKKSLGRGGVLMLLLVGSGVAQEIDRPWIEPYAFDFTGGGARAEGMGKAFLGVSDDVTGGSWNPAGLYDLEKPTISLSYGSLMPRGSSRSEVRVAFLPNPLKTDFDYKGSFSNITAFNFAAPVRIKGHQFVGTFNLTRHFDEFLGAGYSFPVHVVESTFFGFVDTAIFDNDQTTQLHGGMNSVNVGFGTRVYKNISAGVSVNIFTGAAYRETHSVAETDSFVFPLPPLTYFRLRDESSIVDTNRFSGYNVTFGFKHTGEKLGIGMVVRSPFSLNVKTGRSIVSLTKWRGPEEGEFQVIGSDTVYFDNMLVKYKMPLIVGAGVGYRVSEKLLLAFDAEYRNFSDSVDVRLKQKIDPGGDTEDSLKRVDPGWNNSLALRVGAEYRWEGFGIGEMPLRAGVGYVPLATPNVVVADTSTAVKYSVSAGTGIHWNQIHLDIAYTFSALNLETVALGVPEAHESRDHHLNFSFTGIF